MRVEGIMRTVFAIALAAGLLAVGAPLAHAAPIDVTCALSSVAEESVTGGAITYTGVAAGYVVSDTPEVVSIRCVVTVDGVEVSSTPEVNGGQVATTVGQVTFTADTAGYWGYWNEVHVCAVWTAGATSGTTCRKTADAEIPAAEIGYVIQDLESLLDVFICPVLDDLSPGVPGVVDIAPDGDLSMLGIPAWTCFAAPGDAPYPVVRAIHTYNDIE